MSAFAEGGTVKRKSRPRSTKAAVVYAHTIADELLAMWGETLRDAYRDAYADLPFTDRNLADVEDGLYALVGNLRDLRHEVEQP